MLFNSLEFLFVFLPIILIFFSLISNQFRVLFLLISSLIFYGVSGFIALSALMLAATVSFFLIRFAKEKKNKITFYSSILFPLIILLNYKYLYFFGVEVLNFIGLPIIKMESIPFFLKILLPAGMSFYTLQIISFCIDYYEDKIKPPPFLNYFLYISFFPQLIAGPIIRYFQIENQLKNFKNEILDIDYPKAFKLISFGLCMKVFGADYANMLTETLKNEISPLNEISFLDTMCYIFLFSTRIYFDFSAYSIMAIGIALLFGIKLPQNFNDPYLSESPKDFWKRWHITLSYWLKDYVYIRLNGNKKYVRNILIVFLLSGLWHGAGFNFLIWGLYHAFLVLLYKLSSNFWNSQPKYLKIMITFLLVSLGWPLFDIGIHNYKLLIDLTVFKFDSVLNLRHWLYLFFILSIIFFIKPDNFCNREGKSNFSNSPYLHGFLIIFCILFINLSETFIYFRF